eukprot:3458632-Prymnesium_polylepis.1
MSKGTATVSAAMSKGTATVWAAMSKGTAGWAAVWWRGRRYGGVGSPCSDGSPAQRRAGTHPP